MTTQNPTLIAIERATKNLQKIMADTIKATADFATITDRSQTIAMEIEDQQVALANLKSEFDTARRTSDAELKLRVLEDSRAVLAELLAKFGLAEVTNEGVTLLQAQVASLNNELANGIAQAKKEAQQAAYIQYSNDAKAAAAAHALEIAQTKAQLEAKDKEISFLSQQISYLQKQIEEERATRLQVAQAEANKQGVVVNAGK